MSEAISSKSLACSVCDELLDLPALNPGARVRCSRCHHTVLDVPHLGRHAPIALALAAAIFLITALSFPMLSFSIRGRSRTATLIESATELIAFGEIFLGIIVLMLIVVVPIFLLGLTLYLLFSIEQHRWSKTLPFAARLYGEVRHWKMVEVYAIGVLVSLSKIAGLAHLELGVAFWSLLMFAVCFEASVLMTDEANLWHDIRQIRSRV